MHRLWLIALSLCCCLLAVAIWTSSKSQLPPLADATAVLEAARYLRALRASWTEQAEFPESERLAAEQALSSSLDLSGERQPEKASAPTLAEPLPTRFLTVPETEAKEHPRSEMQQPAEFVASEMVPNLAAVERTSAEARVSIMQRPLPSDANSIQSTPANSSDYWELTAQELQVASTHLSYGKTLARKGATASARNEFLNALAVVAQSRDLRLGGKDHVTALNQAVLALTEAEGLFAKPGSSNLDADVSTAAAGHLSRILDPAMAKQLTRAEALDAYQDFARRNFHEACGRNWLASETFYALGRLHNLLSLADPAQQPCELNKALTFHQAALNADSNNFASANELGVLLARQGQLENAKRLLIHSVTLNPRRETWTNLATVHQRLGETTLARLAADEAKTLGERTVQASASPLIRLVAPSEFEAIPNDQDSGPAERTVQHPNEARNPPLR